MNITIYKILGICQGMEEWKIKFDKNNSLRDKFSTYLNRGIIEIYSQILAGNINDLLKTY